LDLNSDKLTLRVYFELLFVFNKLNFILILLLNQFELSFISDLLRVNLELSLVNLGLRLDKVSLSLCLSIGNGETSGANSLILSLYFPEVLIDFFILNLGIDLEALQHAVRLLLKPHGLMLSGGFLRPGLNFESHINRFLKGSASLLFDWVN
jgi:hypothetical protein